MSNPLINMIRLNGHEYELIKICSPQFCFTNLELPPPFEMLPGVKGRYAALRIEGSYYGVKPMEIRKSNPLTRGILIDVFKWTHQEAFNSGHKFHKEFTGHRWFELYFDASNNDVTLKCFRLKKGAIVEQVLFDGEISDITDFAYLCNLLHIE